MLRLLQITLNVELVRRSVSTFDSSSQAKSVAGSISQDPRSSSAQSPMLQVFPELLPSMDLTSISIPSPSQEVSKSEPITSDELPLEELEPMIEYEDLFDELDAKELEDEDLELFFMSQMESQTEMSYFERADVSILTDPEKFAHEVQTDLTALDEEKGPRTIIEALLPPHISQSMQTTPPLASEETQTSVEMEDKCVGGKVEYGSTEVQTIIKEMKDVGSDATIVKHRISVQTELPTLIEEGTQVETEKQSQSTETYHSVTLTAVASDIQSSLQSIQTERKEFTDSETQANPKMSDSETQAKPRTSDSSTETEITQVSRATEPDYTRTRHTISQTEAITVSATVSAGESHPESTAIQSEISNIYKVEDPSEAEGDLTYMVDSSTEQDYELVMQHATTQHTVSVGDFSQQHYPEISDASSQAVVNMKEETVQTARSPVSCSIILVLSIS